MLEQGIFDVAMDFLVNFHELEFAGYPFAFQGVNEINTNQKCTKVLYTHNKLCSFVLPYLPCPSVH